MVPLTKLSYYLLYEELILLLGCDAFYMSTYIKFIYIEHKRIKMERQRGSLGHVCFRECLFSLNLWVQNKFLELMCLIGQIWEGMESEILGCQFFSQNLEENMRILTASLILRAPHKSWAPLKHYLAFWGHITLLLSAWAFSFWISDFVKNPEPIFSVKQALSLFALWFHLDSYTSGNCIRTYYQIDKVIGIGYLFVYFPKTQGV